MQLICLTDTVTRCFCAISPAEACAGTTAMWIWAYGEIPPLRPVFALFGEPEPTPVRDLSGKTHRELFLEEYALFEREMAANADLAAFCRTGAEAEAAFRSGRRAAFLSVEGRSCWTAPWSGWRRPTPWGFGPLTPHGTTSTPSPARMQRSRAGLTPQGRAFVRKMERLGMLVDVSHLSDPGFWDVAEELSGPFFASHSNARAVFSHPRNLTDEQFTAIIDHNGWLALTSTPTSWGAGRPGHRHRPPGALAGAGGERTVALGGDLDGCSSLPEGSRVFRIWTGCGTAAAELQ